ATSGRLRRLSRCMNSARLHFAPLLNALIFCTAMLGLPRLAAAPTIFVLGDSTAHNTAKGKNGEQCAGWGTPLAEYFDPAKATVANVAHAGTSSRSYFNGASDWPRVLPKIKAGDFVLLVFGINDGAAPPAGRGSLPGIGDETVEVKRPDGTVETAHT